MCTARPCSCKIVQRQRDRERERERERERDREKERERESERDFCILLPIKGGWLSATSSRALA